MKTENLKELKKNSKRKMCQGDVNIYALSTKPAVETKPHDKPTLVIGQSGNHHRLTGKGFSVGTFDGKFLVEVTGSNVAIAHEQHKPPIKLTKGVYLVDRALEKGVFDDMINPVAD
jgi:hypothetical protein